MNHSLFQPHRLALAVTTCMILVACGGGGGSSQTDSGNDTANNTTANPSVAATNPAGAASFSGKSATYQGPISGLGSIVVNGVRFETTDSVVYDSDDFSTNYDSNTATYNHALEMGMTVSLYGDVDDAQSLGRAARIRVVGGVRGTVVAVDTTALTLTLPTQTVKLSASTTYGGTTNGLATGAAITSLSQLAALVGNPLVTVYGLSQADGSFLATRVVVTNPSAHTNDVAVRGVIKAIAGNSYTLQTASNTNITVVCNPCTLQPSGTSPIVGDEVRALAIDNTQWNQASSTLNANRLQFVNAANLTKFSGAPSTVNYAKIKGVATQEGGRWLVGGIEVSGASLVVGSLYEIKGTWTGSVLNATKVEVDGERSFSTSSGASQTYTHELYGALSGLSGNQFSVQGVPVNAAGAYFSSGALSSLSNGTFVEVKGSYVNGTLNATKVEIKSVASNDPGLGRAFEMYGQVSGWTGIGANFSLTRYGVVYTAKATTNTSLKYGLPVNGSFVEVKGYMDADNIFQVVKLEVKTGDDQ